MDELKYKRLVNIETELKYTDVSCSYEYFVKVRCLIGFKRYVDVFSYTVNRLDTNDEMKFFEQLTLFLTDIDRLTLLDIYGFSVQTRVLNNNKIVSELTIKTRRIGYKIIDLTKYFVPH